jgi:hypothetical protein
VNNIRNVNITNVYSRTATGSTTVSRVSFNGGRGGIAARATAQEQAAMSERHIRATTAQVQHIGAARSNRALLAKTNNGQPPITATGRAGRFNNASGTTAAGNTGRAGIQSNTRTIHGTATAPRAPRSFGQAAPRTFSQTTTPGSVTHAAPRSFSRSAPANAGPAPRNFGQAEPRSFGQRGSGAIRSTGGPQSGAPHAGAPSGRSAGKGAAQPYRQGQGS